MNLGKGQLKVLALLAPFIKKTLFVSKAFIQDAFLARGKDHQMEPFLQEQMIARACSMPAFEVGGSALNLTRCLAFKNHVCKVLGTVGGDVAAHYYRNFLKKHQIEDGLRVESEILTSQVLCLLDEDHGKTTCSYQGASMEISAEDLKEEVFKSIDLLILDLNSLLLGYLPLKAIQMAQKTNARVLFYLSPKSLIATHQSHILSFIWNHVHFLVAEEASLSLLLYKASVEEEELLKKTRASFVLSKKIIQRVYFNQARQGFVDPLLDALDFLNAETTSGHF